jgi:probable F420-dependent oxidoreductase
MKFMVEYPVRSEEDGGAWLNPQNVITFAKSVEELGLDGLAFSDHPVPSRKWLDAGGHETFDPFVGLAFCAAVTSSIRLMTHLAVVPYRNPLLQAKSMASVDILSGGRTTFVLGAGYLRSEFSALGVDVDERNELFDEAVESMTGIWTNKDFSYDGRHFSARAQSISPGPVQQPYPPLWVGGNSKVARERVAKWGDGWSALVGSPIIAKTSRTPPITGRDELSAMISDVATRLLKYGRSLSDIDIMCSCQGAELDQDLSPEQRIDEISRLASIGVSWIHVILPEGSYEGCLESIGHFVEDVSSQIH